MARGNRERRIASCAECAEHAPVWVFEDGSVVPIGTNECPGCGADAYEVVSFDDEESEDAEAV